MADLNQAEWQRRVDGMIKGKLLKPGRGRVLVARDPSTTKIGDGTLERAEQYKEVPQTGTIVAHGEKRENAMGTPVDFVHGVGARVIINQMAGKRLAWFGLDMAVLDEDEVVVEITAPEAESGKI